MHHPYASQPPPDPPPGLAARREAQYQVLLGGHISVCDRLRESLMALGQLEADLARVCAELAQTQQQNARLRRQLQEALDGRCQGKGGPKESPGPGDQAVS